jgi:TonB-linked SusC/RagA family outer membrane protein
MKIINKKRFMPLGLASLMLLMPAIVPAQNDNSENTVVVTGIVTDAALGTAMAGVRVQAYNNALHSTMTKSDGSFSIKVPDYVSSLTFSVDGCNTVVRSLNGKTDEINVMMYSDAFSEIYSSQTVSTSSVSARIANLGADIEVDNQIQQSLQGSVLSVIRSGQLGVGAYMQIDGINTLNINTQPLVVLDGIILDMGYDRIAMHDGFYNNLLANLQLEDIESVEILKNGYGIYGAKGANGVILIKSKRNKSMATKIDVNLIGSYQTLPGMPEMMNASQYRSYASELLGTTGARLNNYKFLNNDPNIKSNPYYYTYHNNTDWSKEVYREAFVQNYNVNVQGGDEIANYNLSVGYAMGDATLVDNDFSRFNLRLNSDIILSDHLSLRFDANYSDITRDMRDDGAPVEVNNQMINSPGFLSLVKSPFLSPYSYDDQGRLTDYIAVEDDYLNEVLGGENSLSNPLAILVNGEGLNKNYFGNRLITLAVTPKWQFGKRRRLTLYEHFSYVLTNADENYYIPLDGTPEFRVEGIGMVQNKVSAMNAKQDGFSSDTYVTFNRRYGAHDVDVRGGVRYVNNSLYQTSMTGYNSGNDKTPNMNGDLQYKDTDGTDTKDISITWWAQGDYNFKERYYLSASMGVTSSSRFGGDVSNGMKLFGVPWGIFPSISGAWLVSAEPWFNLDFVNYLKLNAGLDITGNDGFDDSASRSYFSPVKVLGVNGVSLANIGNTSLEWETTRKLTAGLEMNLFNNRLNVSANVFSSKTDNLLSVSSLSYLTGLPNTWSNGGSLSNKGFDASFNVKIINSPQFKWEAGASIGHYKNTVDKLPGGKEIDYEYCGATIRTQEGSPVGVFYGYKTNGVFASEDQAKASGLHMVSDTGAETAFEAGDMIFANLDGDAKNIIDENDMTVIGDPNPDFYGRIFTRMGYKNLSLSATFTYSVGGDIYNYQRMLLESGSRFMNQTVAVTNRWTAEGQITDIPRADFGDPHGNNRFSDRWIEDGSYLRLKNITLSYKIPFTSTYLQGITVWGSANNLFTLTKYLGSDPEFSASNNVLTRGVDRGLLPQSTNFSFGLKINL